MVDVGPIESMPSRWLVDLEILDRPTGDTYHVRRMWLDRAPVEPQVSPDNARASCLMGRPVLGTLRFHTGVESFWTQSATPISDLIWEFTW